MGKKSKIMEIVTAIVGGQELDIDRSTYIVFRAGLINYARFTYGDDEVSCNLVMAEIKRLDAELKAGAYGSHKWHTVIADGYENFAVIVDPIGSVGLVCFRQFFTIFFGLSEWVQVSNGVTKLVIPESQWINGGQVNFAFADRDIILRFPKREWLELLEIMTRVTPDYIEGRVEEKLKERIGIQSDSRGDVNVKI